MDKPNKKTSFTLIAAIIGFMIAIQFQTVKKPIERDTRDIWQLRDALLKEKELQSNLLTEIRSNEKKLAAYDSKRKQSKEQALRDTLQELKQEAGLTEVTAPGIILKIEPVYEEIQLGKPVTKVVSPELLKRLLNELNMYGAKYVSIDGRRIINTTVIRDINSETKIDGHVIRSMPFEVRAAVDNMKAAEKLFNRMQVSKSTEEFFIENLRLTVTSPNPAVTVPAYDNPIRIKEMETVEEGGSS
ncbi:DUF881 domain-containing protein [Neobacillus massiliamazoniensis]|uniref:YlxX n=1 Tax=Neobacillus massiliamazoniensis TaxID=1499688 RepID=A0A0U1NRC3_9BACI|nr:DUF881 domain-containing protein [Neobacillus massiliamazoniensis]CRK80574.1 YlxX [Neobacillus massiliamazoniensis]